MDRQLGQCAVINMRHSPLIGAHIIRRSVAKGDDSAAGVVGAAYLFSIFSIRASCSMYLYLQLGTYYAFMVISLTGMHAEFDKFS